MKLPFCNATISLFLFNFTSTILESNSKSIILSPCLRLKTFKYRFSSDSGTMMVKLVENNIFNNFVGYFSLVAKSIVRLLSDVTSELSIEFDNVLRSWVSEDEYNSPKGSQLNILFPLLVAIDIKEKSGLNEISFILDMIAIYLSLELIPATMIERLVIICSWNLPFVSISIYSRLSRFGVLRTALSRTRSESLHYVHY